MKTTRYVVIRLNTDSAVDNRNKSSSSSTLHTIGLNTASAVGNRNTYSFTCYRVRKVSIPPQR